MTFRNMSRLFVDAETPKLNLGFIPVHVIGDIYSSRDTNSIDDFVSREWET